MMVWRKATAANIIAGNKLIGHVDVTGVKSKYPYALMLAQNETERLLMARLPVAKRQNSAASYLPAAFLFAA
jgi:hypothetical protein